MANVPVPTFVLADQPAGSTIEVVVDKEQLSYLLDWKTRVSPGKTMVQFITSESMLAALNSRHMALQQTHGPAVDAAKVADQATITTAYAAKVEELT